VRDSISRNLEPRYARAASQSRAGREDVYVLDGDRTRGELALGRREVRSDDDYG